MTANLPEVATKKSRAISEYTGKIPTKTIPTPKITLN